MHNITNFLPYKNFARAQIHSINNEIQTSMFQLGLQLLIFSISSLVSASFFIPANREAPTGNDPVDDRV